MPASSLDQLVSLCKRRGFIFPGSEIYGGLANTWDYGPRGVTLKNALRDWWWEYFVDKRQDMYGIDASIFMNPRVWEASGHVANFNDAKIDCKKCKGRFRADHLIEEKFPDLNVEGKSPSELTSIIQEKKIVCPRCGERQFTEVRKFNLLFETPFGSVEADKEHQKVYLRGEIAQAMFVNFKNILNTMQPRLPFGIASIGKAFRNEITPGNFTYRTVEFDLMEFEYFIRPEQWEEMFAYWLDRQKQWIDELGFGPDRIRVREHTRDELSHYSKRTVDVEYQTPFGWKEMFGLAYRTDFDLSNHMKFSGDDLQYTDPDTVEKFIPHVIEPTFGLTRLMLMILLESYDEDDIEGEKRVVLRLPARIAPIQVAILPLSKKEHLVARTQEVFAMLQKNLNLRLAFDITGSIGKRYRRQDEIGTPKCITVDFGTLGEDEKQGEKDTVTIRDRDTLKQERVSITELVDRLTAHHAT